MDVTGALHLLVDVVHGTRAALTSQEAKDIHESIDHHFHRVAQLEDDVRHVASALEEPKATGPAPAEPAPPAQPFGTESQQVTW